MQRMAVKKARKGMENGRLRVGIDLDDTITAAPGVFSLLAGAMIAAGHEVHIVTYRPDSSVELIGEDLKSLGVPWTHIHHPTGFGEAAAAWKRSIAQREQLDLLIDDDAGVIEAVADVLVALRYCSQ